MGTIIRSARGRIAWWIQAGAVVLFVFSGHPALNCEAQSRQQPQKYTPPPQPPANTVGPTVIVSPGEDYRIGPSDVIEILVEDAPELSLKFRVGADGDIAMPVLGRVSAQDKTPQELAKIIAERLRGEYLNNPHVVVTVAQINSRTYFIQGAVNRPGLYQVEGQPSLLKLITVAGGLHENHGSTAFIIHESKVGGDKAAAGEPGAEGAPAAGAASRTTHELQQVNLNGLLRGNFDQNLVAEPGDIIYIPPGDVFFVAGEVNAPGSFRLKDGTTLRQAISLAQGTTFKAVTGRGIIFREDPASGRRQEVPVDVGAVMGGKANDVMILANDIIIVPGSRLKSVTESILSAFGANAWRVRRGL